MFRSSVNIVRRDKSEKLISNNLLTQATKYNLVIKTQLNFTIVHLNNKNLAQDT